MALKRLAARIQRHGLTRPLAWILVGAALAAWSVVCLRSESIWISDLMGYRIISGWEADAWSWAGFGGASAVLAIGLIRLIRAARKAQPPLR
jgi:hypothetical protein